MEHTKVLGLTQYERNTPTSWIGNYNNDMAKIDNAVGELITTTSSINKAQIPEIFEAISDMQKVDVKHTQDIALNTASIARAYTRIDDNVANIDLLDKREAAHYNALSKLQDTVLEDVAKLDKDIYRVDKNTQVIRKDVNINTSSISKLQVRVQELEDSESNSSERLDNIETGIENLKEDTATLDTNMREARADISKLDVLTASISDKLKIVSDTQDTADAAVRAQAEKIEALQTKTDNITDGVKVPFSFGQNASGEYGYIPLAQNAAEDGAEEQVVPFVSAQKFDDLQQLVEGNVTDIGGLLEKTKDVKGDFKAPFDFGIAPGGAYGYFRNGSEALTPFVTEDDVSELTVIKNIDAKVANIAEGVSVPFSFASTTVGAYGYVTKEGDFKEFGGDVQEQDTYVTVDSDNKNFLIKNNTGSPITVWLGSDARLKTNDNGQLYIRARRQDSGLNSEVLFGGQEYDRSIKVPFSFGVDDNGNYGYIKAGADTVTPFNQGAQAIFINKTDIQSTGLSLSLFKYKSQVYLSNMFFRLGIIFWAASSTSNIISYFHRAGSDRNVAEAAASPLKSESLVDKYLSKIFKTIGGVIISDGLVSSDTFYGFSAVSHNVGLPFVYNERGDTNWLDLYLMNNTKIRF